MFSFQPFLSIFVFLVFVRMDVSNVFHQQKFVRRVRGAIGVPTAFVQRNVTEHKHVIVHVRVEIFQQKSNMKIERVRQTKVFIRKVVRNARVTKRQMKNFVTFNVPLHLKFVRI